jgi:hypothetical protein
LSNFEYEVEVVSKGVVITCSVVSWRLLAMENIFIFKIQNDYQFKEPQNQTYTDRNFFSRTL